MNAFNRKRAWLVPNMVKPLFLLMIWGRKTLFHCFPFVLLRYFCFCLYIWKERYFSSTLPAKLIIRHSLEKNTEGNKICSKMKKFLLFFLCILLLFEDHQLIFPLFFVFSQYLGEKSSVFAEIWPVARVWRQLSYEESKYPLS